MKQLFLFVLQAMDYFDMDVVEYLYKNKPDLDSLTSSLCKDLSKACNKLVRQYQALYIILWINLYIHLIYDFLCFSSPSCYLMAPPLSGFIKKYSKSPCSLALSKEYIPCSLDIDYRLHPKIFSSYVASILCCSLK